MLRGLTNWVNESIYPSGLYYIFLALNNSKYILNIVPEEEQRFYIFLLSKYTSIRVNDSSTDYLIIATALFKFYIKWTNYI